MWSTTRFILKVLVNGRTTVLNSQDPARQKGKIISAAWLVLLVLPVAATFWLDLWVLTAAPIGFLLGFCLHKGDLCPSAALSEAVILKDRRKLGALGLVLALSLAGFALLHLGGLIRVSPQHCFWLNNLIGGALFGSGMVLAGGCITGCLYKSAAGNINSVAGLVGILPGYFLVHNGPLQPVRDTLMAAVVKAPGGEALSLHSLTGIPFPWLALVAAALVFAAILPVFPAILPAAWRRRKAEVDDKTARSAAGRSFLTRVATRPWKPWQAAIAVGLLASFSFVSSAASGRNYPLGMTSGVTRPFLLLTGGEVRHVYDRADGRMPKPMGKPEEKIEWWEVILVVTLFAGAAVSARLSGTRVLPKPVGQTVAALFGGLLIGAGAAVGFGCFFGHVLSGWPMLSAGSIVFGAALLVAHWAMVHIYLIGFRR
jgi:uncharacterized protein